MKVLSTIRSLNLSLKYNLQYNLTVVDSILREGAFLLVEYGLLL